MSRIGVDIDGVLYPFEEELRKFLLSNSWSFAVNDMPTPTRWEFYLDWGMDLHRFLAACEAGVKAGRLFWHGAPYKDAVEQLWRLRRAGHTIVLITNRDFISREEMERATEFWLSTHSVPFDELHIVKDKTLIDVDYHIDDNVDNHLGMLDAGVKSFLLAQPWNTEGSAFYRIESLAAYVDVVLAGDSLGLNDETEQVQYDDGSWSREEVRVTSDTGGEKGQKSARLGSLDPLALLKVAEVAGFGEIKYDRLNYMRGYDWSLSFDAGQRHRLAFWSGEDFDPESGLPHLAHAAWHDLCMLAFFLHQLGTDDRYRKPE